MNISVVSENFYTFAEKQNIMIERGILRPIQTDFKKKNVIVLLGARRVGKTTLLEVVSSGNPKGKASFPKIFAQTYPESSFEVITPDNFWTFIK